MGFGGVGRLAPDPARRKPERKRKWRWLRHHRRSQRQALIPAICRTPHRRVLRNPESKRRKQHDRNLLKPQVATALRTLPGIEPADEHEKAKRVGGSGNGLHARSLCFSV